MTPKQDRRAQILREAWIGDAVLALYARERILREDGLLDGPKAERMTSNQFLSAFGEPSEVEANIGRVYQQDGLAEALAFIEARYMPLFAKHEERRAKPGGRPSVRREL